MAGTSLKRRKKENEWISRGKKGRGTNLRKRENEWISREKNRERGDQPNEKRKLMDK